MLKKLQQEYLEKTHAMQSGVAMKMNKDSSETEPKHLRVGVNSALVETSAIVSLLVKKGLFTMEEWFEELNEGMQKEVDRYEKELSDKMGTNIKLG